MSINRVPVDSSNIRSIGYDFDTQILEIEFLSGGIYRYSNVPSNIHDELMAADSKGRYFAANIKEQYTTEKIS